MAGSHVTAEKSLQQRKAALDQQVVQLSIEMKCPRSWTKGCMQLGPLHVIEVSKVIWRLRIGPQYQTQGWRTACVLI